MRYLSLCSGIEAATVAWHPLGWTPVAFSQFDPEHNYKSGPDFPSAVLAHHYPDVPNLGDMTKIDGADWNGKVDIVVGGPPCQSYSIAGLRKGMADARGGLTLRYVQLIREVDPKYAIYENVPGLLSSTDNAFGCLLAGLCGASDPLVPPGKSGKPGKWPDAGVVAGPERWAAWRIIDAQGFDPQRRRRVFVVSTRAADRLDPGRVLFEAEADLERYLGDRASTGPLFSVRQSLRGDSASGREAREGATHSVAPCLAASGRGFERTGDPRGQDCVVVDHGRDAGGVVTTAVGVALRGREGGATAELTGDVMTALRCGGGGGDKPHVLTSVAFGGNNTAGPIQVSTAINAHGGPHGRLDFESETFVLSGDFADYRPDQAAAAVRAKGGDAGGGSEVLVCHGTMDPCSQTELVFALGRNNGGENAVCIHSDATKDIAPTMRAMGHSGSHANAGGQLAVCITGDVTHTLKGEGHDGSEDGTGRGQPIVSCVPLRASGAANANGAGIGRDGDPCLTLDCDGSAAGAFNGYQRTEGEVTWPLMKDDAKKVEVGVRIGSAVRRLTPLECERLQGFPDSYSAIPWKKHSPEDCPDGPRYRALGNSMNCEVMAWIGRRIAMVEAEHSATPDLFGDLDTQPLKSPTLFDI